MSARSLLTWTTSLMLFGASIACDSGGKNDTKAAPAANADEKAGMKADMKPEPAAKLDEPPPEAKADDSEKPSDTGAAGDPPDGPPGGDTGGAKEDEPKGDAPKADAPKGDAPKTADKPKTADQPKGDVTASAKGKEIYAKKCKNCHGDDGAAKTKIGEANKIPSWKDAGWKAKHPLPKVIEVVENGEDGTKMKPFKGKLTDEEIKAVSEYARSLGA